MRFSTTSARAFVPVIAFPLVPGESLRCCFALQITNVRHEETLTKHELAACQVLVPGWCPVPPCLSPLVVCAPRAHRHAGPIVGPRLQRVAVEDEAIDTYTERLIAQRLNRGRMLLANVPDCPP